MKTLINNISRTVAAGLSLCMAQPLLAQNSLFTYQGHLSQDDQSTNGRFDFEAQLFDGPDPRAASVTKVTELRDVQVTNGLFVLNLDFGVDVFGPRPRYLEIRVRRSRLGQFFTTLEPRQLLTATPHAIYAEKAGGLQTATPTNFSNTVHVDRTAGGGTATLSNIGFTGNDIAVAGAAESFDGIGVRGSSSGASGVGVSGQGQGPGGTGVYGYASPAAGPNGIGIHGYSPNGLAGRFDGNVRISGELHTQGELYTRVLTILGGADIAEPFEMNENATLPEGSVVVIDDERPGLLEESREPYDRRVAGVISGAGGVRTGLQLQQEGLLDRGQPVALTGRVYVKAEASSGAIKLGDLLTTSGLPGHAMKVSDHSRAQGAILGKAMTPLDEGTGLVLVLVTLQ